MKPVKVRWDVTAERAMHNDIAWVSQHSGGPVSMLKQAENWMDYLAAHAVLDVPAGVPSVEELVEIADIAVDAMDMSHPFPGEVKAVWSTAIRDAVLAGAGAEAQEQARISEGLVKAITDYGLGVKSVGTYQYSLCRMFDSPSPNDNTAPSPGDQVEVLARVLHKAQDGFYCRYGDHATKFDDYAQLWLAYARAAIAHFGSGPCQECAKMKEQRKAFRRIVIEGAEEVRNRIDAARAALEDE